MIRYFRISAVALTHIAVSGFLAMSGSSYALQQNALPKTVKDIAAALQKGDEKSAKKMAAAAAKDPKQIEEISDLMHMYRPVSKGGLEIEKLLKKPGLKNAPELGNLTAAMAELTLAKGWSKNSGQKTMKAWNDIAEDMRVAGLQLAKADNAKKVTAAATKINNACVRCHSIFKE